MDILPTAENNNSIPTAENDNDISPIAANNNDTPTAENDNKATPMTRKRAGNDWIAPIKDRREEIKTDKPDKPNKTDKRINTKEKPKTRQKASGIARWEVEPPHKSEIS